MPAAEVAGAAPEDSRRLRRQTRKGIQPQRRHSNVGRTMQLELLKTDAVGLSSRRTETIIFVIDYDNTVKAGLPPKNQLDNFSGRSQVLGKINNIRLIAFNPEGELYAVSGSDLYTGPMPSNINQDWFTSAKRVGKAEWDQFHVLFFHSNGLLYGVTKSGEFYQGPAPQNENISWIYRQATLIGKKGWNAYNSLFFDKEGTLYAVSTEDALIKGKPPTKPDEDWHNSTTTIGKCGWIGLSHFMAVDDEGKLWCVNRENGNIYRGSMPTDANTNYFQTAEFLGHSYNYKLMSFARDKTIQSINSFEFLPDEGKTISQSVELVEDKIYDNRKSTTLL
ncbi:uncharacterized protein WCC33_019214 [Rhinophrynus dorsalis]